MAPLVRRLGHFLRRKWPADFCCPCLAVELGASVVEVMDVVQGLRWSELEFEPSQRECRRCGMVTSVVRALSDSGPARPEVA
jgi:hypothetical protein